MPLHPRTCSLLYTISCILDAVDGYAARRYDQSTSFGAVLDMVTDRCTTSCLLVFLASAFPRWSIVFQGLISLDLASHYIHMYATLTMGINGQSHKKVDEGRNYFIRLYYTNRVRSPSHLPVQMLMIQQIVLFWFCALNELFFIALYLLSFSSPRLSPTLLSTGINTATSAQSGLPAQPKSSALFLNPWSAGALEMARANKMDSRIPWALAIASSPVMAAKQFINVIQLIEASRWLAEGDLATRRRKSAKGQKRA